MEIFVSWSGELSKKLGEAFSSWIPGVLQSVTPYFTPDDLEKGTRWSSEVAKELQQSGIGIIVLTRDNLSNPWIMFEAGALSKQIEESRICPILFGLEKTDLVGPLVQFQATSFTEEDMKKLVKTINNACGDNKLMDNVLDGVFDMWWPKLEEEVNSVMGKERGRGDRELRSDRELIEEILSLTRMSMSVVIRESEQRIAVRSIEELDFYYRRLMDGVELDDMNLIRESCRRLGKPIGYIKEEARKPAIGERAWGERERGATGPVEIGSEENEEQDVR